MVAGQPRRCHRTHAGASDGMRKRQPDGTLNGPRCAPLGSPVPPHLPRPAHTSGRRCWPPFAATSGALAAATPSMAQAASRTILESTGQPHQRSSVMSVEPPSLAVRVRGGGPVPSAGPNSGQPVCRWDPRRVPVGPAFAGRRHFVRPRETHFDPNSDHHCVPCDSDRRTDSASYYPGPEPS